MMESDDGIATDFLNELLQLESGLQDALVDAGSSWITGEPWNVEHMDYDDDDDLDGDNGGDDDYDDDDDDDGTYSLPLADSDSSSTSLDDGPLNMDEDELPEDFRIDDMDSSTMESNVFSIYHQPPFKPLNKYGIRKLKKAVIAQAKSLRLARLESQRVFKITLGTETFVDDLLALQKNYGAVASGAIDRAILDIDKCPESKLFDDTKNEVIDWNLISTATFNGAYTAQQLQRQWRESNDPSDKLVEAIKDRLTSRIKSDLSLMTVLNDQNIDWESVRKDLSMYFDSVLDVKRFWIHHACPNMKRGKFPSAETNILKAILKTEQGKEWLQNEDWNGLALELAKKTNASNRGKLIRRTPWDIQSQYKNRISKKDRLFGWTDKEKAEILEFSKTCFYKSRNGKKHLIDWDKLLANFPRRSKEQVSALLYRSDPPPKKQGQKRRRQPSDQGEHPSKRSRK